MKNIKKSYIVVFILLVLAVVCFSTSYAIFMNVNEQSGKLNIVVGDLAYKLESKDLENNKITVAANTTKELNIKLTSLNEIISKYELYYLLEEPNENIEIGYSANTQDPVLGTINANETKEISVVIKNNDTNEETVEFSVAGGLVNNELALNDGYSLNKELNTVLTFADTIKRNNTLINATPTLTTSSNNTTDASGLYESTATNDGKSTYYFRGNVENNYVSFAGFTWRIVRINEDGTVRLILGTGINNNTSYNFNPNGATYKYFYYTNSNVTNGAKKLIDSWYQTNIVNKGYSSGIVTGDYFCEQAKVKSGSGNTAGNATMTLRTEYEPNFKCETDGNGKGIVNSNVGLITYDEAIYAGGYYNIDNNSYYLYSSNNNKNSWTMSPAGYNTPSGADAAYIWRVGVTGLIGVLGSNASTATLRPVINLKADTAVVGNGTSDDPYKIKVETDDVLTIGTPVTAIDGSKWHVLEDSNENTETVTLLSDYNLNSDGTYNTECGRDINSTTSCSGIAFDADNTNTYNETDSNNIGYFIKNTYAPLVTAALPDITSITLPTAAQIATADSQTFSQSELSLTSSWILLTSYWTKTANTTSSNLVWVVRGTAADISNIFEANDSNYIGARPVITTPKSNLILE